jgi:hypothetical protein
VSSRVSSPLERLTHLLPMDEAVVRFAVFEGTNAVLDASLSDVKREQAPASLGQARGGHPTASKTAIGSR